MTAKHGLSIPELPQGVELPVKCLARAASIFQRVFVATVEGHSSLDLLATHQDVLIEAEKVLGLWRDHFGLDVEEMLDELEHDR